MTNRYTLAYRPGSEATDLSEKQWEVLPPLAIANRQWLFPDETPETEVRACYNESAILVRFRVFEASPTIRHEAHNAPVYEDSCVEFFLQPQPGEDGRYLNFELNAAGFLLLEIGGVRGGREKIETERESFAIRAAAGLTDPSDGRTYWELAFRIPFDFLRRWFPDVRPNPGLAMRGNFYKCGDRTPAPHYISWRPIDSETPNFHRIDSFGELVLGGV